MNQARKRLTVLVRDFGGVVPLKQRWAEHAREEREAVRDVRAHHLVGIALSEQQAAEMDVRLAVEMNGDWRDPRVVDGVFRERADVERRHEGGSLGDPPSRAHVTVHTRFDEPAAARQEVLCRYMEREVHVRRLPGPVRRGAVPREPSFGILQEEPLIDGWRQYAAD